MKPTTPVKAKAKRIPRKSTAAERPKKIKAAKELKNVPNLFFLSLAGAAALGSALLSLSNNGKKKLLGQVVGLLVPSLMSLSLYKKVSEVENEVLDIVKH